MAGYTYATLTQAIKDYTDNQETTFVANIPLFIQSAEERLLKRIPLEVFRKNALTTMTIGNKFLPKPSDWLFTYSLSIIDNNNDHKFLLDKDVNFVQEYWPTASDLDEPTYYADYDINCYILGATPDKEYVTEVHYYYRPASLTTTTGTQQTWISENASLALFYGSLVEAYGFIKGEPDMIQYYDQKFQESLQDLGVFSKIEGIDFLRKESS